MANVEVINAPDEIPESANHPLIFLSGSLKETPTWRSRVIESLKTQDVKCTILNPVRPDWDSTWKLELGQDPFDGQVRWELEGIEKADVVVIFIEKAATAHITLLELGFALGLRKRVIVGCEPLLKDEVIQDGFKYKGNVQISCARQGVEVHATVEEVIEQTKQLLATIRFE